MGRYGSGKCANKPVRPLFPCGITRKPIKHQKVLQRNRIGRRRRAIIQFLGPDRQFRAVLGCQKKTTTFIIPICRYHLTLKFPGGLHKSQFKSGLIQPEEPMNQKSIIIGSGDNCQFTVPESMIQLSVFRACVQERMQRLFGPRPHSLFWRTLLPRWPERQSSSRSNR